MAEITAALVKELREIAGAGMMDCKRALAETAKDGPSNAEWLEAAQDWLRKKGIAGAAKKAGRVAAEGLVAVVAADKKAVLVEVNSETDFVARNDKFPGLRHDSRQAGAQRCRYRSAEEREDAGRPDRGRKIDAIGRDHRGEHEPPPDGGPFGEGRRGRHLHAQCDGAEHGEDRSDRRSGIDR